MYKFLVLINTINNTNLTPLQSIYIEDVLNYTNTLIFKDVSLFYKECKKNTLHFIDDLRNFVPDKDSKVMGF